MKLLTLIYILFHSIETHINLAIKMGNASFAHH